MNLARIRVGVCLGEDWQVREQVVPCGLMDEEHARQLALQAVVPDDLGGIVEVSVPGWIAYYRIDLIRFFGLGLELITNTEAKQEAKRFLDSLPLSQNTSAT